MGLGGAALIGFGQNALKDVKAERFKHNQRVLEQAKQALLMYAYNYPTTSFAASVLAGDDPPVARGPGRLPCPDMDIPGTAGSGLATNNTRCKDSGTYPGNGEYIGRLPWLQFGMPGNEFLDADGEHLWYALSDNFTRSGAPSAKNSDTLGTISLRDQSGNIIYDGSTAGIVAVIIAPGSSLAGQDRAAGANVAANYLDFTPSENNSVFVNSSSAANDGFIPGSITDANNNLLVNDQFIIITAQEVTEMAQKSVLQIYKKEIDNYLNNNPGGWYPWLEGYDQITDLDEIKEINTGATMGRIPSIFGHYFKKENTGTIQSKIELDYEFTISGLAGDGLEVFNDSDPGDLIPNTPYDPPFLFTDEAEISFTDVNNGQLLATTLSTSALNLRTGEYTGPKFYFWDEPVGIPGTGSWEICIPNIPANAVGDHRDCNQTAYGVFVDDPGTQPNGLPIQVRKITLKANFILPPDFTFTPFDWATIPLEPRDMTFEIDYSSMVPGDLNYNAPTVSEHAKIRANFAVDKVDPGAGFVYFEVEGDTDYFANYRDVESEKFQSIINVSDIGSVSFDFDGPKGIKLDYFPELPSWAANNENNWNSSIMMAYAPEYAPGGRQDCEENDLDVIQEDTEVPVNLIPDECIYVDNLGGVNNKIIAMLLLAGEHDFVDDAADNFSNDLDDIFEGVGAYGNTSDPPNLLFDKRPNVTDGNKQDTIFILDTL